MELFDKEISILYDNNRRTIKYTFNNYTTYQDLLEYVYSLFPNYNLCSCFVFSNNLIYINSDTLLKETVDINFPLKLVNRNLGGKCNCSNIEKKYIKKSKRDIINDYEQKINNLLENQAKVKDESISNSEREKANLKQEISNLKIENNSLKRRLDVLEEQNKNLEKVYKEKDKNIDKLQKEKKNIGIGS